MPVSSPPTLAQIAQVIHRVATDLPTDESTARLVHLHPGPEQDLCLGFWDIPPVLDHPIDTLVGFRAPSSWTAIGLVTSGRLRSLDDPHDPERSVQTTMLADRSGGFASVLDGPDGLPLVLTDPAAGSVPDVLARVLGLATPPPDQSTAVFMDLIWLDRIAAGILHRPHRARSWRWLADRHPMRGPGAPPDPEELAARTQREAALSPWSVLREKAGSSPLPAEEAGPPGGTVLGMSEWFDDGSMSRWTLRRLPPPEALLPDLLAVLPPDLGELLVLALADVEVPSC